MAKLQTVPQGRESTKLEKDYRENESVQGKATFIVFNALCLTRSYFFVLTTTPNNLREGLMGQVPTLGTSFRRKKTTIKRE